MLMSDMEKSRAGSRGQGAQAVGKVRDGLTEMTFRQNPGWESRNWPCGFRGVCVFKMGTAKDKTLQGRTMRHAGCHGGSLSGE